MWGKNRKPSHPRHRRPSNSGTSQARLGGRSVTRVVGLVLLWLVIAAGAVTWALGRWIVRNFGHITPDQALMNLDGAAEGADPGLVRSAMVEAVLVPLLAVAALGALVTLVVSGWRQRNDGWARRLRWVVPVLAVVLVPGLGAWSLGSALQVRQYMAARDPSLDLRDHYAVPAVSENPTRPPTNLVLIYLESIETTFADHDYFGVNMLEPIESATEGWDRIESLQQYPGGGWTMAGVVATQCGIPLRMPPSSGIEGTDKTDQADVLNSAEIDAYLPGATCLGDILAEHGYRNVYMGGAYAGFASKGQFYTEHGYTEFMGREHWEDVGETEYSTWGLSDERLFAHAKDKLEELEASGEPFALTLLTLDTHDPAPRFDSCEQRSDYPLVDATRCSMAVVSDFLSFMESRGYLDNTTVVVTGDHLKLRTGEGGLGVDFGDYPDRTIFNRISSPIEREVVMEEVNQLDLFPTILESLGFEVTQGRAGLGVSAYNRDTVLGSLRQLPADQRDALIWSRSPDFYAQMWGE